MIIFILSLLGMFFVFLLGAIFGLIFATRLWAGALKKSGLSKEDINKVIESLDSVGHIFNV
jgi:hypothetical protein